MNRSDDDADTDELDWMADDPEFDDAHYWVCCNKRGGHPGCRISAHKIDKRHAKKVKDKERRRRRREQLDNEGA